MPGGNAFSPRLQLAIYLGLVEVYAMTILFFAMIAARVFGSPYT